MLEQEGLPLLTSYTSPLTRTHYHTTNNGELPIYSATSLTPLCAPPLTLLSPASATFSPLPRKSLVHTSAELQADFVSTLQYLHHFHRPLRLR